MIKIIKKNSSYIFIILLSIMLYLMRTDTVYFIGVKYITTFLALDIMFSITFTFLFFKVYLDNYYYHVLNRNNIIIRLGKRKYNIYIIKKILTNSFILFIINMIIDYILIRNINFIYLIINICITTALMIILPKKKEYNYELLILIIIMLVIKLITYYFLN